jgi:type IV pilus assembly protein PilW
MEDLLGRHINIHRWRGGSSNIAAPVEGRCLQRGLSVVELMVGIALGLILVTGMLGLLVSANKGRAELARAGQVNENGRFALQLIAQQVVHSGFWAGFVPAHDDLTLADGSNFSVDYPQTVSVGLVTDTPAVPDPCKKSENWSNPYRANLIALPVQTYQIVSGTTLPVCEGNGSRPAGLISSPKDGTDVLFFRHAEPCVAGSSTLCPTLSSGEEAFQLNNCSTTLSTTRYVFSGTSSTAAQKRDCATTADRFRYVSSAFYIRTYSVRAGDGIPTLMQAQFGLSGGVPQFLSAQPLIPGIDAFRVEIGVDDRRTGDSTATINRNNIQWADPKTLVKPTNRGDGVPDNWMRCGATGCTADQLVNAVAVRLHVLARSEQAANDYVDTSTYTLAGSTLGPFRDGYRRHVFVQTVRLNNVSSRRETPG